MRLFRTAVLGLGVIAGLSACTGSIRVGPGDDDDDDSSLPEDERFPPELDQPYTGPAIDYYDNSFINFRQLKNKVNAVFADDWVRNGENMWETHMNLFGGADFIERFTEPRVATTDFLLGLDTLAPDICGKAASQKTGPFAGIDPAAALSDTQSKADIDKLYQKMLFRSASAQEQSDGYALLTDINGLPQSTTVAWASLCEALIRHPDFIFTLPPAIKDATGDDKKRLLIVKVAQDLVARPPTDAELTAFVGGSKDLGAMVDDYLASDEFRDYYFHKIRLRTESSGLPETDEPARLWTYIAVNGLPFQQILTADYTVDESWAKASRPAEHGASGLLTMPGFVKTKPGLPHFNYSARVMGDFLGQTFEVPPAIVDMRQGATAASTVDPTSVCFGCHQTLTPLAFQRLKWADDGTYREVDEQGQPIDDSDHGIVEGYAFKGTGMPGFAAHAVKKEAFIRRMLNAQYGFLVGRDMRVSEDERVVYRRLWDLTISSNGSLKAIIKDIILSPTYQGGQ